MSDLGDRDHAATDDGDALAVLLRQIEDELDAVDRGAEAGDHHTSLGAVEDLLHARADRALGIGIAGAIGIGGVGEQEQDAALAVFGERVEVEELVIGGSRIDLEVTSVDDYTERSGDGERDCADDRVRNVDELDLERADLHDLLGLDRDEAGIFFELVFFEAAIDKSQREIGAIARDVDLGKKIRDGADVIFVAMGQNEGADLVAILLEERQIGHHQIDTEELGIGKHHAAVHNDDVVGVPDGGHVHAELAEAAERDYLQFVVAHPGS